MRKKILLFIHGVRHDDKDQEWRETLNGALRRHGAETLEAAGYEIVAPSYLDLLAAEAEPDAPDLPQTYRKGQESEYLVASGQYWDALHRLERCGIRSHEVPPGLRSRLPVEGPQVPLLMNQLFPQAVNFRKSSQRRKAVYARLVRAIPRDCDVVIVAHSLGSVVAADLIYYLPPGCKVRLLLTVGSPLALSPLREHLERRSQRFPFELVGAWLNLVGAEDFVTGHRGLSKVLPEPLDVFVDTGPPPRTAHSAKAYLDHDAVVTALRWVDEHYERRAETNGHFLPDAPITDQDLSVLIGAQYALRVEQSMDRGEQRERFAQARLRVMGDLANALADSGTSKLTSNQLMRDNSRYLDGRIPSDSAIPFLLTAHMMNPLNPFEFDLSDAVHSRALGLLAHDINRPSTWSDCVMRAEDEATKSQRAGKTLKRAVFAVAGVAAIAAMPALVLAVAPAGLVGGAAIVGGLTALGPGGMLGGIGIVSLLGGAGGAMTARALTAGSAAQVEQTVIHLQALSMARETLDVRVEGYPEWHALVGMEDVAAEDLALKQTMSDPNARSTKEAEHKLRSVQRGLAWMRERQLGPPELAASTA